MVKGHQAWVAVCFGLIVVGAVFGLAAFALGGDDVAVDGTGISPSAAGLADDATSTETTTVATGAPGDVRSFGGANVASLEDRPSGNAYGNAPGNGNALRVVTDGDRPAKPAPSAADDDETTTTTAADTMTSTSTTAAPATTAAAGNTSSTAKPAPASTKPKPAEPTTTTVATTSTARETRKSLPRRVTTSSTTAPTSTTAAPASSSTVAPATSTTAAPATTTTEATTTSTRPPTTMPSGGTDARSFERRVIDLTNRHRAEAGCTPLANSDKLHAAALAHSTDMAVNNYFSHTGRDGSSAGDRIEREGYAWRMWAENIAAGYRTPEAVVDGWMNSSGHRKNILNCELTEIGVGFHDYYWTQNFGRPA